MIKKIRAQQGIAALITILVVGATTLVMVIAASLISMDGLEMGYHGDRGNEALALAEACVNDTARRLKIDPDSATSSSLSLPGGYCIIDLKSDEAGVKVFEAGGVAGDYYKKIRAQFGLDGGNLNMLNWEEI